MKNCPPTINCGIGVHVGRYSQLLVGAVEVVGFKLSSKIEAEGISLFLLNPKILVLELLVVVIIMSDGLRPAIGFGFLGWRVKQVAAGRVGTLLRWSGFCASGGFWSLWCRLKSRRAIIACSELRFKLSLDHSPREPSRPLRVAS